jgi:hypothetical protein
MIAMCRGAAVAGNPEDALDVEMRIEAGQFLDCRATSWIKQNTVFFPCQASPSKLAMNPVSAASLARNAWLARRTSTSEAAGGPFYYMLNSLLLKTPRHALVCLLESRKLAAPLNPS